MSVVQKGRSGDGQQAQPLCVQQITSLHSLWQNAFNKRMEEKCRKCRAESNARLNDCERALYSSRNKDKDSVEEIDRYTDRYFQ